MRAACAMNAPRVLVTGAAGYMGRQLVAALAPPAPPAGSAAATGLARRAALLVATDVREPPEGAGAPGALHLKLDVRAPALEPLLREHAIDTVVHLAAIVTPGPASNRELEYSVDVLGTKNLLEACVAAGVRKLVVTSSGAAYGYHADNPAWITEEQPLRGNPEFAYAHHKHLVEEMLADYRARHPALVQVVLRVGTILGESTANQITALFERRRLPAVRGSASPFVFVWDQDVVGAIMHAVFTPAAGVFNLAGDGALTVDEIAARMGKRCLVLPATLLRAALALARPLGLTRYGPEQVSFLRYRPVLDNTRLKREFGYQPRLSSEEAFELWRRAAAKRRAARAAGI
jgi:UDP-glucose 4-epimerase